MENTFNNDYFSLISGNNSLYSSDSLDSEEIEDESSEFIKRDKPYFNTYQDYHDYFLENNPYFSQSKKEDSVKTTQVIPHIHIDNNLNSEELSDSIKGFLELCSVAGIDMVVTSGYRKGAKTSSGNDSYHATGSAVDIAPKDRKSWEKLEQSLVLNQDIREYMLEHNIGIFDETTPEALKKTGGTGKHFHIGPDKVAIAGLHNLIEKYKDRLG